mgnify:FL=1
MRERIRWSFSIWVTAIFLNLLIALTFWGVLDTQPTLALLSLSLLLTLAWAKSSEYEIVVNEKQLRVGKARIDLRFVGEITALDSQQMKVARGVAIDPSAYLAIRSWIKTGVKVTINDPRDPTPYWLISSKRFQKLAAAISAEKN